ncbi:MAG: arginyltransferase [Ahniella sp.]|nr:arginyltransferase [Ahniella sp.]
MKRAETVRLFKTMPHACGYYADRIAENLVIDPAAPNLGQVYGGALAQGYRRSGGHLYRPACPTCADCIATRVAVADFRPNRTQSRVLRRNHDLKVRLLPAKAGPEHLALYQNYLATRHPGGGMDAADGDEFRQFLLTPFARTMFLEARLGDQLLACAVTDATEAGLSAVYTFFEPTLPQRSLGVFAILKQIEYCRQLGLPYLYLGFWLDGHPKMAYKAGYQPQQRLGPDGDWQEA